MISQTANDHVVYRLFAHNFLSQCGISEMAISQTRSSLAYTCAQIILDKLFNLEMFYV